MASLVSLLTFTGLLATSYAYAYYGRSLKETNPSILKESLPLTPSFTHAPVWDLEWVGPNDQVVYAITSGFISATGGLWRSKDGGNEFQELTPKLAETSTEKFSILNVFAQKSNEKNVIILGTERNMWISNDQGDTLTKVEYPGGTRGQLIRDLRFNPRHDSWLLMHVKRATCKQKDRAHDDCPKDLMLNSDVFNASSTWENLTANSNGKLAGFVDFDWAANLCPKGDCEDLEEALNDNLILATGYARAEDYDQPWDKDVHFLSSSDYFKSVTTKVKCGNQLEVVGRSVYLAVANTCPESPDGVPLQKFGSDASSITLFTSIDAARTFNRACLPAALQQDGYELEETHDGSGALVIVNFDLDLGVKLRLSAASVYAAGPHHAVFSLSLTNVYQGISGSSTDFTRVEGIPGIYIANQMVPYPSEDGSAGAVDPTPDMSTGGGGYMDYYLDPYDLNMDYGMGGMMGGQPLVETRITYNAGGRWQRIRISPSNIRNSECIPLSGEPWYLHLHGTSSMISPMGLSLPSVYSSASAPGLIIGTGNAASLGSGLDIESPNLCTWLSRDGGMTWEDVGVGAYIYEFADWGGAIIMARHPGLSSYSDTGLASEVKFSLDYGSNWESVSLTAPMYVSNIRIEPDGQQPIVLIYGEPQRGAVNGSQGAIYYLNLKDATGRGVCVKDDFETWLPPNANGTGARYVLGQKLGFTRRKKDSKCFYGRDYKRPAPKVLGARNCSTMLDMECDYGFIRTQDQCSPLSSDKLSACPVVDRGIYNISGQRKVHGDMCLTPAATADGSSTDAGQANRRTSSRSSGWVTMLILLLVTSVLVGGGFAWWRYRATEEQQEMVREVAETVSSKAVSAWWLLVDKTSELCSAIYDRFRRPRGQTGYVGEEMGYFQPLGDPGHDVEGRGNVFTIR